MIFLSKCLRTAPLLLSGFLWPYLPLSVYAQDADLAAPIVPMIVVVDEDPAKVRLGRMLFNDKRLSNNNTISCASCHDLKSGGGDNQKFSKGVDGLTGVMNTPTVFNVRFNLAQFWDGRVETLEEQVDFPVHNPVEMASNWDDIVSKLSSDARLKVMFAQAFTGGEISATTISSAIASFERTLVTPNSRFDRFLLGNQNAISAKEKRGFKLFKSYGCSSCHQGVAVGGNMYEKMGVVVDYFKDRGNITPADYGRYNVTQIDEHKFEFKVPGLRNIALTAPYFHDGTATTLEEAVEVMAYYQLGRILSDEDRDHIVAFLLTLTGEYTEIYP